MSRKRRSYTYGSFLGESNMMNDVDFKGEKEQLAKEVKNT
jgi:hypothetical protein